MPERFEEHRKAPAGMGQAAGNFEGLEHEAAAQMSDQARSYIPLSQTGLISLLNQTRLPKPVPPDGPQSPLP